MKPPSRPAFEQEEGAPPEKLLSTPPFSLQQLREVQRHTEPQERFPIVGLGGSAGSLLAFEAFFTHMPPGTGMAFVVVTHLLPDHSSNLVELLQHSTTMPVAAATDGLKVRPNRVYVLPPDRDMSILHGTLLLFPPAQARGRRLPIDSFLQSLAKDVRERAVCIIFSGLGADGTVGLKTVMENFGMVMVQAPETAEFDSMPRAAIATEFVDYVLPAEQLPAKLLEYVHKPLTARPRREVAESASEPAHALQKIFILVRTQTGHDFSFYKRNTLFRRIERRMSSHQIREFTHYVRYLQENSQEVKLLFKELLIGVTKFFRDREAFDLLKLRLLSVLRGKPDDATIRVWAPGCSTGEEAYSLAMTLREALDGMEAPRHLKIQIFATDINGEAINFARAGIYPDSIAADVSPARLERFFQKQGGYYQIRKEVRDLVVFALHNLNKDAPFTKLDLVCCRNLLIYLSAELQKNIIPVFHYALNPGGLLLLGPSENLTGFQDLFQPLDVKWKISRRSETSAPMTRIVNFPFALTSQTVATTPASSAMLSTSPRKDGLFASLVQKLLLRTYTPPAVVINSRGEILYVNGRTGRYLEPAPGLGSINIFEMAREELNYELSSLVHKAAATRQDAVADNLRVKTEAGYQLLRITVKYLDDTDTLAGLLLVVFEDQPTPRKVRLSKSGHGDGLSPDSVVASLEKELQFTKRRLQTTIEEMESSVEELKSTNEELQSANEELQSTNEEAMTNKEEMQSLNEELMTLNTQYLSKTEELSMAANDMKNLLDATEIATIFLDNTMVIKRFTPSVARIIRLLPSDAGRPITHFASTLRYENLAADIQQVLDRLVSIEANIQINTGEWFVMRILPYRTLDNYISGTVITFSEITGLKHLEEKLQEATRFAESIVETVREPLVVLDKYLNVLTVSRSFAQAFGFDAAAVRHLPLARLNGGAWNQPELHRRLQGLLGDPDQEFSGLRLPLALPGAAPQIVYVYGRRIMSDGHETSRLLLGVERTENASAT